MSIPLVPFFAPAAAAPANEIYLTRGMTLNWPWQATIANAQNQQVPLPLTTPSLEIIFLVKGTLGDDDGNAFIIKDNYAWMGLTITDAANGWMQVSFLPNDTNSAIFPYYPCLLTWTLKLITPSGVNVALGSGPLVIQDSGIQHTTY